MHREAQNDLDLSTFHKAGLSISDTSWLFGVPENELRYLIETSRFPAVRSGARWFVEPRFVRDELLSNPAYTHRREDALIQLDLLLRGVIKSPKRGSTSKPPEGLDKARKVPVHLQPKR